MRIAVYLLVVAAICTAGAAGFHEVPQNEDPSDDIGMAIVDSETPQDEFTELESSRKVSEVPNLGNKMDPIEYKRLFEGDIIIHNPQELKPLTETPLDEFTELVSFRKGCNTGKACRKSKGNCIPSSETCNGREIDKGCGTNCTCCIKEPEKCEAKGICKVAGGYCVMGAGSCTGSIIQNGCIGRKNGKNCVCCLNDNNCPNGFHRVGTECFKVYQEFAAWDEARQICKDHGYELAEPEDLTALARFMYTQVSHNYIWIGGRAVGGSFKYRSGRSPHGTIPWGLGYPGDKTDLDYCLILRSSYPLNATKLASFDCLGKYNFLCEPACPEGFIRSGSGCFKVVATAKNWETAERNCYQEGLQIAEPEDPKGLAKMLYDGVGGTRYVNVHFWLGARGGRINGATIAWNSGDAVPIPYPIDATWHPGYPRYKTSGYCLQMYTGYYSQGPMYDYTCGTSLNSICEWKCPLGFFRIGKRCYKAFSSTSSWAKARETCIQAGLTLAEPLDPSAVGDYLFTVTGNNNYWLGGRGDGNRIRWSSGEAIPNSWSQWRPGNPGNKVGSEYCLRLAPELRTTPLTSTSCSTAFYPLCQKYITN